MENVTIIILVVIVLLVTRELWTWYLKLDKITNQNTEIIRLLSKLANEPEPKTSAEKIGNTLGKYFAKNKRKAS